MMGSTWPKSSRGLFLDKLWSKVEPLVPARRRQDLTRTRVPAHQGFPELVANQCLLDRSSLRLFTFCGPAFSVEGIAAASSVRPARCINTFRTGIGLVFFRNCGRLAWPSMTGCTTLLSGSGSQRDGAMGKAPLATECVGRNPTDRGKKRAANAACWSTAVESRGCQSPSAAPISTTPNVALDRTRWLR